MRATMKMYWRKWSANHTKGLQCLLYLVLMSQLFSCQDEVNSVAKFRQWIHQPEHGLSVEKKSNNLVLTASYLPTEYLAFRDLKADKSGSQTTYDSLKQLYQNSLTFVLTLRPDKEKEASGDVMYRGVSDFVSYKQRVSQLNFGMTEYIDLKVGDQTFKPVLTTFENTYSLVEHRSLYIVFTEDSQHQDLFNADQLELIFHDEIFNTGISHFKFNREDLQQLPKVNFLD